MDKNPEKNIFPGFCPPGVSWVIGDHENGLSGLVVISISLQ